MRTDQPTRNLVTKEQIKKLQKIIKERGVYDADCDGVYVKIGINEGCSVVQSHFFEIMDLALAHLALKCQSVEIELPQEKMSLEELRKTNMNKIMDWYIQTS